MNIRNMFVYWRAVLTVAEMTLRQTFNDTFILFAVLVQPLLIAILALYMLKDKGADYGMFVVVGSGLTGLWSSLLFISGKIKGQDLQRVVAIDADPVYQTLSYSLSEFLRSDLDTVKFWFLIPGDYTPFKMVA